MCFSIRNAGKHKEMKVAKKNIDCLKVLEHNYGHISSPYKDLLYFKYMSDETKVMKTSDFSYAYCDVNTVIEKGLHTYRTVYPNSFLMSCDDDMYIHKAYIPKGAKYYYNEITQEYVSNELVVYKETIDFQEYLSKCTKKKSITS